MYGVQFSTDGTLILAHSFSSGVGGFIVVFNRDTGTILSARGYSTSAINNFER